MEVNDLAYGMMQGNAIGMGRRIDRLQDDLQKEIYRRVAAGQLTNAILDELKDIESGKRTDAFFSDPHNNKLARKLFRDKYYEHCPGAKADRPHTVAETDAYRAAIEKEYRAKNIMPQPKKVKPAVPAVDPRIALLSGELSNTQKQLEINARGYLAEMGVSAIMEDEVIRLLEGDPNALALSTSGHTRNLVRERLKGMSEILRELPEAERRVKVFEVAGGVVKDIVRKPVQENGEPIAITVESVPQKSKPLTPGKRTPDLGG